MHPGTSIIGISPGTRSVGIAVFKNGKLREWQLKTFKGAWSKSKLHWIVSTIKQVIIQYDGTAVALKLPHASRTSKALNDLVNAIQRIVEKHGLPATTFSLKELEQHFAESPKATKKALIEVLANQFPELREYRKKTIREPKSTKPKSPYEKVFEAVAAALIVNDT